MSREPLWPSLTVFAAVTLIPQFDTNADRTSGLDLSKAATTEAMPLLESKSRAISKIPLEIWDEILNLATRVENGDEFGELSTLDTNLNYGEMVFGCDVPPRDQRYALATRRRIVLVCRAWHTVALPYLWSHLIIDTQSWMYTSLGTISPSLWRCVKRLDIVETGGRDLEDEDLEYERESHAGLRDLLNQTIYPQLSNLHILRAPQNLATGNYAFSPSIVSLHPSGFLPADMDPQDFVYDWAGGSHFWTSARILDIDLDFSQISEDNLEAGERILFPQLKKLCIRYPQEDSTVHYIAERWVAPVLEALSLQDCHTNHWVDLITWSSKHLTTLELSAYFIEWDAVIPMPRLTSIIIENCFCEMWETVIDAPNLLKLSFCDKKADVQYQRNREAFRQVLSRVVGRYPSCKSVSFCYRGSFVEFSAAGNAGFQSEHDTGEGNEEPWPLFEFDPTNSHARAMAVDKQWLN